MSATGHADVMTVPSKGFLPCPEHTTVGVAGSGSRSVTTKNTLSTAPRNFVTRSGRDRDGAFAEDFGE
jgi:hypothetical protein